MKVATWNVNSINARLDRVRLFLEKHAPDICCFQELKCEDARFPAECLQGFGYEQAVFGQRTYNGVAVVSRFPIEVISKGFADGDEDTASRFLLVKTAGIYVASAYVPNGQAVGTEKYDYKLRWLKRLRAYLDRQLKPTDPLAIAGDFNVAPEDRDVHDPKAWQGMVLFSEPEKKALSEVLSFGLKDTLRKFHSDGGHYSWWDYRALGFPKNKGLRIDFILASLPLYERCERAEILRDERKGPTPSDHAPVVAYFTP